MKILTGALRGQTILFKENPGLRPTTDKARKAVFDMLQGHFDGVEALDLFSGTGAMGFEAISQGARSVTFVDSDSGQCKRIQETLKRLEVEGEHHVHRQDAHQWLERCADNGTRYDFIFIDPPYGSGLAASTLMTIAKKKLLKKGGLAVFECRHRDEVPKETTPLKMVRDKYYGHTRVLVFQMSV